MQMHVNEEGVETPIEELRLQLQAFARQFDTLNDGHDVDGEMLSGSSRRALLILLDCHDMDRAPMLTDLVDLLSIDKSNVTRLCQKLEAAEYIEIRRDQSDRRIKRVRLSQQGLRLARQVNRASYDRFEELFSSIPTSARTQVLQSIHLLNAALATLDA